MEKLNVWRQILNENEENLIPIEIKSKLEKYISSKIDEVLTCRALCSAKIQDADKLQIQLKEKLDQLINENNKLKTNVNVLEKVKNELELNLQQFNTYNEKLKLEMSVSELQLKSLRAEFESVTNEKSQLSQMVDRRNNEIEMLKVEYKDLETKFKDNLNAKCEALSQLDNCSTKEATLDTKAKIFEQDKLLLQSQIRNLRVDLERNNNELTNIRRESTLKVMAIEAKLFEKIEELKLTKSLNSQLEKANESLSFKVSDLSTRIKEDAEETQKLIEHYEKELQSQKKLVTLYKESCDENVKQTEELSRNIKELQSLLREATDEYGALENKLKQTELKYQEDLNEKDLHIKKLNDQLTKEQQLNEENDKINTDHVMDSIAPSASVSKRLRQGGLSLSELYTEYVKTCDQLHIQKKENERLDLQFKHILAEIEERAPILKKERSERNHLLETNAYLSQQIESIADSHKETQAKFLDLSTKVNFLQRENQKLKTERTDLARQVCHLLQKINEIENPVFADSTGDITSNMTSNEFITNKLVTFSNIEELQETNTKLLLLVRDLSSKLEEMEESYQAENDQKLDSKITVYSKKIEELRCTQELQTEMIESCMKQRDRYKELYLESIKHRKTPSNIDVELTSDDKNQSDENEKMQSKINELTKLIAEKEQSLKDLEITFDKYKTEKCINEKLITDQLENMRIEIRDLTSRNYKIASVIEFKTEQLKINNKTMEMYKKQISSLEERNKNYELTISRHETSLKSLTDEIIKTQNKLTTTEIDSEHLRQEVQRLRELEIRHSSEREFIQKERQNQNLLLQNIETIKTNIQKSEVEGKLKLENNLSELNRECSALRRRLQEEEDRFRVVLSDLDREKGELTRSMTEKDSIIASLKNKLSVLEDELNLKNGQVEELITKHNSSTLFDHEDEDHVSLVNELRRKLEEQNIEISSLHGEVLMVREHSGQYCRMLENAEKEIKEKCEEFENTKQVLETQINQLKQKETLLTEKIDSMERDFVIQSSIFSPNQNTSENDSIDTLKRELTDALKTISEVKNESSNLRAQFMQVSEDLRIAEQKYANEMILHSADIQAFATLKDEHQKLLDEHNNIKLSKESTNDVLSKHQEMLLNLENKHQTEKEELESQIRDLQSHNSVLLDQIESLSSKLAAFTSQDDQNIRFDEDQSKTSEELLRIIKFLRKEKEIAVSKLDVISNESIRLRTENEMLLKKIDKLSHNINETPSETQMMIATTIKHEELLRKLETINAITDSNRILREERDSLSVRVKDLTESVNKLEGEILPLKEKDKELSMKLEGLANENASLRIEATRWRQRANLLVERSNKSSPEDIKRLQQEKENLCKSIISEKEECKKLNDELSQCKTERVRLETEMSSLKKTNNSLSEEISKQLLEINVFKENLLKATMELKDVKNFHKQEIEKLTLELSDKDAQLTDTKNKEMQIRKIAKKYKDSYLELQRQQEAKTETGDFQVNSDVTTKNDEIQTITDENAALKKQVEELKTSLEKEERNKSLLKEAKQRILGLKENYMKELQQLKNTIEQLKSENAGVQMGESDLITLKTKENEELTAKINQLTRQIALQSVKPMPTTTTAEKNLVEPVRTANVRPITPTTQHSTSVTMWRGSETPLASIRPMTVQGGRSVSMSSSSQTIGMPLETPATTSILDSVGSNQCGTSMIVATVPPLGSSTVEQAQESNIEHFVLDDSNNCQSAPLISQTVALVSPRVEVIHGVDTSQQSPIDEEQDNINNKPESESSTINMQPASSSVSVSTSNVSLKRNREIELACGSLTESPQPKKTRSSGLDTDKKSSTKFLNEVEYQVPTSSQRDQDDDVIEIDDEREAIVDIQLKERTIQDVYSEEQNTVDGSIVDPSSIDISKSFVSSVHQSGKATSSDVVVKPSSSEVWFGDTKNDEDMIDEPRNPILHTTTINSSENSVEPGNDEEEMSNNGLINVLTNKNENDEQEELHQE